MTHDAYELSAFFSGADPDIKEKALLEVCRRDPELLLDIIRSLDGTDMIELKSLLNSGRKIEAIKRYRRMSGVGLKEAKDFVEAIDLRA